MNLNYVVMKQDLDKLLAVGFIALVEEATPLAFSIVVVPKKNGKLWVCVDFQKLNAAT